MITMNPGEVGQIPFFFILGSARSGTTLLQQMLDSDPHVMVPIESKLIMHLKAYYQHEKEWNDNKIDQLLDDLYKERHFKQYWQLDRDTLRKALLAINKKEMNFANICRTIYLTFHSIHPKEKIQLIGDKNPVYALFVPELMEIFPEAKFIHLVRDPRPVALSSVAAFQDKDIYYYAAAWKKVNAEIGHAKSMYPAKFYLVKYEELISDTERVMRGVCDFLGIEFSKRMFDFHLRTNEAYSGKDIEGFDRFHSGILKPVSGGSADAWKNKLNKQEIDLINGLTAPLAQTYGYAKEEAHVHNGYSRIMLKARYRVMKDHMIIRSYYAMPGFLRRGLNRTTTALYKWFGIRHAYNKHDVVRVEGGR